MKKAITISVITIIGLLLAVLIFLSIRSSRIVYNNDNAIGNSAGNLNNGGLFCEYNDKIYFANPYDYNKLYVMNSDCTNAMKLNDDSVASINVCGGAPAAAGIRAILRRLGTSAARERNSNW